MQFDGGQFGVGGKNTKPHRKQGRYVNEDKITQAVAQMWARIGLDVRVAVHYCHPFRFC